jgi:hypothetical protein
LSRDLMLYEVNRRRSTTRCRTFGFSGLNKKVFSMHNYITRSSSCLSIFYG